jgi:hypothetical protein
MPIPAKRKLKMSLTDGVFKKTSSEFLEVTHTVPGNQEFI